eukprot:CAMPEP_0172659696 /NCGR_PEP_ID=MMETSP1074-20121228/3615_1 /TAXON_ID=2916 /ORGANISM="Ceratium fusus, Strain PA161109" /LENGTH=215 /DNA_ID=CAMNT_0013475223 /DNA_START=132 /DNA_END=775 /DNA_ORIENTATION=+
MSPKPDMCSQEQQPLFPYGFMIVRRTFLDVVDAGLESTRVRRSMSTGDAPCRGSPPIMRPLRMKQPGGHDVCHQTPRFFSCCDDQKAAHEQTDSSDNVGGSDAPPHVSKLEESTAVTDASFGVNELAHSSDPCPVTAPCTTCMNEHGDDCRPTTPTPFLSGCGPTQATSFFSKRERPRVSERGSSPEPVWNIDSGCSWENPVQSAAGGMCISDGP